MTPFLQKQYIKLKKAFLSQSCLNNHNNLFKHIIFLISMTNKLRKLISLRQEGESIFDDQNHVRTIFISPLVSVRELFEAYLSDLQQGVFDSYEFPHLGVFGDKNIFDRNAPGWSVENPCANTDGITEKTAYLVRAQEIFRYVKNGHSLESFWFRAQDRHGMEKVICDIHQRSLNLSRIYVTPRTRTDHLTPLIDARREENLIIVSSSWGEKMAEVGTYED
jgi:hypothetical protein